MVMLTGSIRDAATRQKAEDLTRKVDGVRELYNEIKVMDKSWLKSLPKDFCFQAEDGIRVGHVTGVQTCALPISLRVIRLAERRFEPAPATLDVGGALAVY